MLYRPKDKDREIATSKISKQDTPKQPISHKKSSQSKFPTTQSKEIQMSFLTKSDAEIIKNLNKDIASIGKQLKTCEHALHQANSHNETIKEIIRQKQLENKTLFKSIESYQQSIKSISVKFEELQSNYDRLICKQKIESQDACEENKTELKQSLHKKGNYSAAFLPAFGTPRKFQNHEKSQQDLGVNQDEVESNRTLVRHPMSGYLIEWQKSTTEINIKQKQLTLLELKLTNSRQETIKQQKEIKRLNTALIQKQEKEKHSLLELNTSKDKLKVVQRQNKTLLGKLKGTEQKIEQLTALLKQHEEDKFYNCSIEQIRSMVERTNYKLQIDSYTVDTCIHPQTRLSTETQTQEQIVSAFEAHQEIAKLQALTHQLQKRLHLKQLEHIKVMDAENQRFKEQLKEYTEAIEQYKLKIEECTFKVIEYEAEMNNWRETERNKNHQQDLKEQSIEIETIERTDADAQCDIVPTDFCDKHQQILEKAKMLIQFNQQQSNTIKQLNCQLQRLKEHKQEAYVQMRPHYSGSGLNANKDQEIEPKQDINEYFDQDEATTPDHTFKIEEYSFKVGEYEAEMNDWREMERNKNIQQDLEEQSIEIKTIERTDADAQCDIVPTDFCDKRQQILEKAKMLIQFNQQQANTIKQLNCQLQRIKYGEMKRHYSGSALNATKDQEKEPKQDINEDFDQDEAMTLDHVQQNKEGSDFLAKIHKLKQQRDYFSDCYNQTLTNLKNLQIEFQKQITKAKQQNQDKQTQISNISNDLAYKTHQLHSLKQQIEDYQTKIKTYETDIEAFELQIHKINQLYNAHNQN